MEPKKRYVGVPKMVSIERAFPGSGRINGFIHEMSQSLVLIQQLYDFFLDGYSVILAQHIEGCRSAKQERSFERILAAEGLLEQRKCAKAICLYDIMAVLCHFKDSRENVIIECESTRTADDDEFYIGQILELEKDSCLFHAFTAEGEWERGATAISTDRITRVQFDTPYVRIFSKYLKKPTPPRRRGT